MSLLHPLTTLMLKVWIIKVRTACLFINLLINLINSSSVARKRMLSSLRGTTSGTCNPAGCIGSTMALEEQQNTGKYRGAPLGDRDQSRSSGTSLHSLFDAKQNLMSQLQTVFFPPAADANTIYIPLCIILQAIHH